MKKKLTTLLVSFLNLTILHAQWQLTGNSISSTDFLGTTNSQPLTIKVNNSLSGQIHYNSTTGNTSLGYQTLLANTGTLNTAFGYQALTSNTSATNNDAFGYKAMFNNLTGSANSAFGYASLYSNTSGYNNAAFGAAALYNNTSGTYNVAVGISSLSSNTTGSHNTALGYKSLNSTTTSSDLTAVGYYALYSNSSGTSNSALGYQTLYSTTTGAYNTANGYMSLYSNVGGNYNTATGYQSLYYNTTGYSNVAIGASTLTNNTVGVNNTATGYSALQQNTTGDFNTGIGLQSAFNNYSGANNTALGSFSLSTNTTGNNNTAVGYGSDVNANNYTNTTAIGYLASGSASNQVRIGNSSVTSIGGYANWSNISDIRVKKNIKSDVPGLSFINKLQPITYNLDLTEADNILQKSPLKDKDGKDLPLSKDEVIARKGKEAIVLTGFSAQDVEKAAKSIKYDFSGVEVPKNKNDLYSLRYSDFVIPLVKAVQELSTKNDSLTIDNGNIQTEIENLIERISKLEDALKECCAKASGVSLSNLESNTISGAKLEQNAPNPLNANTIIGYSIPDNSNNAQITITDLHGHTLKAISLNRISKQLVISADTFSVGVYIYTLIIDGKKIDSKQMVITK